GLCQCRGSCGRYGRARSQQPYRRGTRAHHARAERGDAGDRRCNGMTSRTVIRGVGAYLPERVVTNAELARKVDTSDEWILERTGIRERRIAADGEKTSDLAIAAGERALKAAGISGDQLDLIVVATATPDNTFPATAAKVQARLAR